MMSGEIGLALAAIAGALILARLWRTAEARAARLKQEIEALAAERQQLGASLSKQTETGKRQAEELTTLRNRADKAKRRRSKSVDQPVGTTARIRDHQAQVARAELERDRAQTDRDAFEEQVARLERRLEESASALEEASAPRPMPTPSELETELASVRTELAAGAERNAKQNEELGIAGETEARMRKRMSNQEQLYASLRAELEVKKDRLRTQEEQLQRLQALRAAAID